MSIKNQYSVGQRYMSENEPELGMGSIQIVEHKRIRVLFEASGEERIYSSLTAPLKRVRYNNGDTVHDSHGQSLCIEEVAIHNGLFIYMGDGKMIPESELSAQLRFNKPEERFFHGKSDKLKDFNLRMQTWSLQQKILTNPYRGFLGAKVALIPHQYYIVNEVSQRPHPRVLLSDEVGLGKTIEAALILHRLLITGKAQRILVLTPSALVYQWFTELYRKFELKFRAIQEDDLTEEPSETLFNESQQFILSQSFLFKDTATAQTVLSQNWDLVIIDEAHRIPYQEGAANTEYTLIERLAQKAKGLILLSATPEHLGKEGHYSRLKLLDPHRYQSYAKFLQDEENYAKIAAVAKELTEKQTLSKNSIKFLKEKLNLNVSEEVIQKLKSSAQQRNKLIQILVDHYGTSRSVFRNTRKRIDQDLKLFPKRKVFPEPLENEAEKQKWILSFLTQKKEKDKVLLIASTRELAQSIEKQLQTYKIKAALFHEHMTLVQRDRQAAYFTDPDGASVLVCSEIGSEGRNFQCAHTLILYDLPKEYEILEQRIGRLDRIGQKNDIQIYCPFIKGSDEEKYYRFYHEGLHAFESSSQSAPTTQKTLQKDFDSTPLKKMSSFIKEVKSTDQKINTELEEGRNRLIEFNSYHPEIGEKLIGEIQETEKNLDLKKYLEDVFSFFGVTEEEHNEHTSYVHPGDHMYISHFPCLNEDGLTITYDRAAALERDQYTFMSIDHPMVSGVIDAILGNEYGNAVIATWKTNTPRQLSDRVLIEAFFVCESIAELSLQPFSYFPPTLIRILMDPKGKDYSVELSEEQISNYALDADDEKKSMFLDIPKELFQASLKKAEISAQKQIPLIIQNALKKLNSEIDHEVQRLRALQKINSSVTDLEIDALLSKKKTLTAAFQTASLRLDSIRFIM